MGWGSGAETMERPELEEGEACYYNDDTKIDPDIALSYIDEKVQSVLGHFQKDFEGGVSAENLGAKFGGYGSFLPMYQRSPSIWSQPKTPQRAQNLSILRSPGHLSSEGVSMNSTAQNEASLCWRNPTVAPPSISLEHKEVHPGNCSSKQNTCSSSDLAAEKISEKHVTSSNRLINPGDPKTLKVRIKVGPDKTTQKNAAIYSGLGLISPASSTGNSPLESGGLSSESQETPKEWPASILLTMTAFPIVGDPLLSPLEDNLCNLRSSDMISADSEHLAPLALSRGNSASAQGDREALGLKKFSSAGKSETLEEMKDFRLKNCDNDLNSCPKKNSAKVVVKKQSVDQFNSVRDEDMKGTVREADFKDPSKDVTVKTWDSYNDILKHTLCAGKMIKEESLDDISGISGSKDDNRENISCSMKKTRNHQVRNSDNDALLDDKLGIRGIGQKVPDLSRVNSDMTVVERESSGKLNDFTEKARPKVSLHKHDKSGMPHSRKRVSLEGQLKLKGSQSVERSARDLNDKSLVTGDLVARKDRKSAKKDDHKLKVRDGHKDMLDSRLGNLEKQMESMDNPSSYRMKKGKMNCNKRKETDFVKPRDDRKENLDNKVPLGTSLEEPLTLSQAPPDGLISEKEQPSTAPEIIEEHWVQCDRCQKWRLLPFGLKPEHLPEKWLCSMLDWLPGLNRCDVTEDETTNGLHKLYQLPLPDIHNTITNPAEKAAPGTSQNQLNVGFDDLANRMKKKYKLKEASKDSYDNSTIPTANAKKNVRMEKVGKSNRLKDVKQPVGDPNLLLKTNPLRLSTGKLKRPKREMDQLHEGSNKKIRPGLAHDTDGFQRAGLGMSSTLPNQTTLKNNENKGHDQHRTDSKTKVAEKMKSSIKKQADHVLDLTVGKRIDLKASSEREVPKKKQRLHEYQESLGNVEMVESKESYLREGMISVKEDSSDGGFMAEKNARLSQTERRDSSTVKANHSSKKRGTVTRIILSGGRDNATDRSSEKEEHIKRLRVKVASQLTMDDLESLKKDLGCEELSAAATSSSSKVSDSRKSRADYHGVKGSPVESVSSSPLRISQRTTLSPKRTDTLGKDNVKFGEFPGRRIRRKLVDAEGEDERTQYGMSRKGKSSSFFISESVENTVLDFREKGTFDRFDSDAHSGLKASPELGNGHLPRRNDKLVQHSQRKLSDQCVAEETILKNHQPVTLNQGKLGKSSFLQSNDKDQICGSRADRVLGMVSDSICGRQALKSNENLSQTAVTDGSSPPNCHEKLDNGKTSFDDSYSRNGKTFGERYLGKKIKNERESQWRSREPEKPDVNLLSISDEVVGGRINPFQELEFETNQSILDQSDPVARKSQSDLHQGDELVVATSTSKAITSQKWTTGDADLQRTNASVSDVSKLPNGPGAFHQNGSLSTRARPPSRSGGGNPFGASLMKMGASGDNAYSVLKEAEELRDCADRAKESGFAFEANEAYFQAALKFLHGASLLELSCGESNKHGEISQMEIYLNAAKLFERCALEYEKLQDMAAAALAYKCMEVAYMRVVYCKHSSTNRVWHDLQASLQMAPQGESPSSSASDVDNLNNQPLVDKSATCKVNGSHSGNHFLAPRSHPNFRRLLDFTKDVNSAMEACRNSQKAFAAASLHFEKAHNKEVGTSVKRVIDFSFQDVAELVSLVRHAIEAISSQGLRASRE